MTTLLTALLTIATAVVTTLVVEWLAKPGLEARKARILEQDKNLRRLCALAREDDGRTTAYFEQRRLVSRPELVEEYRSLHYSVDAPKGKANRAAFEAMNTYVLDGDPYSEYPPDATFTAVRCAELILTPRWRLFARRRAYREFVRVTTPPQPKQATPSGEVLGGFSG